MDGCIRCGLPINYKGIVLDENKVCNYCRFYEKHQTQLQDYEKLESIFVKEIKMAKKKAEQSGAKYDCIVGLSGGKDGAYITYQLQKKYGMRVLTYTLDNGFSTEYGRNNVDILLKKLDVYHIWINVKESELKKFYKASLRLTKNFCGVCFHFCHYYSHMLAAMYNIPLIVNGRTRSQILQAASEEKGIEPFEISRDLKSFEYQMFGKLVDKLDGASCIDFLNGTKVSSLSYFMYHCVGEQEKMDFLEREIGWVKPKAGVAHADCWAHAIAENLNIKKFHYPVRTGELSELVREGEISVEEAVKQREADYKEYREISEELLNKFKERVEYAF